jgi:hypothetical protein
VKIKDVLCCSLISCSHFRHPITLPRSQSYNPLDLGGHGLNIAPDNMNSTISWHRCALSWQPSRRRMPSSRPTTPSPFPTRSRQRPGRLQSPTASLAVVLYQPQLRHWRCHLRRTLISRTVLPSSQLAVPGLTLADRTLCQRARHCRRPLWKSIDLDETQLQKYLKTRQHTNSYPSSFLIRTTKM